MKTKCRKAAWEKYADNAPADFGDRAFPRSLCPGIPLRRSGRDASVAGEDVVCLVALLFGAVKSSGMPLALALCVDCIALLVMIQADDKVTLAVFALTMIGAYSLRP